MAPHISIVFRDTLRDSEACIQQVLRAVVGPGDLLSSDLRADFATEAYGAWGECRGCIRAKLQGVPTNGDNFATYNEKETLGPTWATVMGW